MKTIHLLFAAATLSLASVGSHAQTSGSEDAARQARMDSAYTTYRRNPHPGPAARAERSMKHGARKTGHAIKHGTMEAGHAVGTGVRATGRVIRRGGEKLQNSTDGK